MKWCTGVDIGELRMMLLGGRGAHHVSSVCSDRSGCAWGCAWNKFDSSEDARLNSPEDARLISPEDARLSERREGARKEACPPVGSSATSSFSAEGRRLAAAIPTLCPPHFVSCFDCRLKCSSSASSEAPGFHGLQYRWCVCLPSTGLSMWF